MKTIENKKSSEKPNKKVWEKPAIKEEQSLLETKQGQYSTGDGYGGDPIGGS